MTTFTINMVVVCRIIFMAMPPIVLLCHHLLNHRPHSLYHRRTHYHDHHRHHHRHLCPAFKQNQAPLTRQALAIDSRIRQARTMRASLFIRLVEV